MKSKIAIARPDLAGAAELRDQLLEILSSDQLTNGREVERFEATAAEQLEAPYAVAVSSCTAGLMLALRCLGVRGEVVLPSFTFFATGHAVLWNGLTPVLADCDVRSFQIDAADAASRMGARTGALLAVHLFGCPAPVDELERLASAAGLALIFDGAHALGARWRGRGLGARGDATVYSLSPTKLVTAGEGGLVTTPHRELAEELRRARNYGKGADYDCETLGLSARMSEMQAALGRAGMGRLQEALRVRDEIARQYERRMARIPGIELQRIPAAAFSARKDYVVRVRGWIGRDGLRRALEQAGIETRTYFDPPLHQQKLYRAYHGPADRPLEVSETVSREILCLPMHSRLRVEDVGRVCDVIEGFASGREARGTALERTAAI